jgi:hypothetical protein
MVDAHAIPRANALLQEQFHGTFTFGEFPVQLKQLTKANGLRSAAAPSGLKALMYKIIQLWHSPAQQRGATSGFCIVSMCCT